ncbi:hypothetical protein SteCoe_30773 [Stentor coeruleus]|uniref:non-specific serine/threonine protein kinase n=1 Tax=Stentor coeruleus TaxID=5963 RepID=A0A1R2B2X2_9CILI|nr:hypothetical protein SteCoe_30773 [Stentor coeruleus]
MEQIENQEFDQEFKLNYIGSTRIGIVTINQNTYFKKISIQSLKSEYDILQMLHNEHIIQVHSISPNNKSMIFEYCSKGDLSNIKIISKPEDLINTFQQLCRSIQYLHSMGFCHLDIKLENFVIAEDGKIKLIDFGHAQECCKRVKHELGTKNYNAPERKTCDYDGLKADIFSLGICLFRLHCGVYPFSGSDEISQQKRKQFNINNERYWYRVEDYLTKNYSDFIGLDEEATKLIELMCNEDPEKRPNIDEVLQHSFFEL